MTRSSAVRRHLLFASALGTILVGTSWPLVAQQSTTSAPPTAAPAPAATPTAPPPWAQGRPDAAIDAQLAPVAPPPIPTAADKLPVDKLKLPKGFKIEV